MDTLRTENVTLPVADGTSMNAYVATPAEGAKLPGLLVFQEAFGVNAAHSRYITERFAKQGYIAIAPELFHRTGPGFEGSYTDFAGEVHASHAGADLPRACLRTRRRRLTGFKRIPVCCRIRQPASGSAWEDACHSWRIQRCH